MHFIACVSIPINGSETLVRELRVHAVRHLAGKQARQIEVKAIEKEVFGALVSFPSLFSDIHSMTAFVLLRRRLTLLLFWELFTPGKCTEKGRGERERAV